MFQLVLSVIMLIIKVDRNWKPTRAEKKKYIVPKEQEPERYFRLED